MVGDLRFCFEDGGSVCEFFVGSLKGSFNFGSGVALVKEGYSERVIGVTFFEVLFDVVGDVGEIRHAFFNGWRFIRIMLIDFAFSYNKLELF